MFGYVYVKQKIRPTRSNSRSIYEVASKGLDLESYQHVVAEVDVDDVCRRRFPQLGVSLLAARIYPSPNENQGITRLDDYR